MDLPLFGREKLKVLTNFKAKISVALVCILTISASSSLAATCGSPVVGDTDNFTTSTDCGLPGVGNGGNADLALMTGLFGVTNWTTDLGKIDTTKFVDDIDGLNFSITSDASNLSGTWELTAGWVFDPNETYAFVMKGGSAGTIAYLIDNAVTAGNWFNTDIPANGGGNAPGLSNIQLFATGGLVPDMPPVPLPAAGWMLVAGIGGLAAMRRRRRA